MDPRPASIPLLGIEPLAQLILDAQDLICQMIDQGAVVLAIT
jgi:hypothetical protein